MSETKPAGTSTGLFRSWKVWLGVVFSVAFLYYALRDVDPAEVAAEIREADPLLFLGAITAATLTFLVRAVRWGALVAPIAPDTKLRSRFAATCIGFMANNLLPARVGEIARAFALSRVEPIPVSASIASLVVERILDGFMIIGLLVLATALPGFPAVTSVGGRDLSETALLLLATFGILVAILFLAVLSPARTLRIFNALSGKLLPARLQERAASIAAAFVDGLSVLGHPLYLVQAVFWTAILWLLNSLAFWLAFLAFDIQVPFAAALFLNGVIALAVAVPSAPGFFGLFEAGFRIGLVQVWNVEVGKAMSCAIAFHIGGFIPVTLIGLYYAWSIGFSIRRVAEAQPDAA